MLILYSILVLIFSVIAHEVAHGLVALKLGDQTAKNDGRLTLNPLKHLDPVGSVIVPLFLALLHGPIFGWAKPVLYDPRNLKNPHRDAGLIAAAGPLANLAIAIIFGLLARLLLFAPATEFIGAMILFFSVIIQINLALAIFNLLPIPPLDGSGVLLSLLPARLRSIEGVLRRYGFIILIILIFYGLDFLGPLITRLYTLIAGPAAFL